MFEKLAILTDIYYFIAIFGLGAVFMALFLSESFKDKKSKQILVLGCLAFFIVILFCFKNNRDFKTSFNEEMCVKIGLKAENCDFAYFYVNGELTVRYYLRRDRTENDTLSFVNGKADFQKKEHHKQFLTIYVINKKPMDREDVVDFVLNRFAQSFAKNDFKKYAKNFIEKGALE